MRETILTRLTPSLSTGASSSSVCHERSGIGVSSVRTLATASLSVNVELECLGRELLYELLEDRLRAAAAASWALPLVRR